MSALVFLILITLTGLLLNHADALGLSTRHVALPLLTHVYGFEAPPIDASFEAGGIKFASAADTLYADGRELANIAGSLHGVVVTDSGEIVLATPGEVLVTTGDAILIERIAPGTPAPIQRLGSDGRHVIADLGIARLVFDPDTMSLTTAETIAADNIVWSRPTQINKEQAERIAAAALGESLSWERFLVDLHSGRILPTVGRYIADISALCLLYLCMSGIVMWFRGRGLR